MSNRKIIATVGMSNTGKSEIVEYLTAHGWAKIYFGGIIYDEMRRRGITITPESESAFRVDIREKEGKDFVVHRVIDEVERLEAAGQKEIILDGLYSWTEYRILHERFGHDMKVIAIVTDKAIRHKRATERKERPYTTEEITKRDWSEIEDLEKGGPIAYADFYIHNDGTIADMHRKTHDILEKI